MDPDPSPTTSTDPAVPAPPPVKAKGRKLQRIGVGAVVTFVFMSLLYGVNPTLQLIGIAVVCTAGLGLIPILFLSWLVGWVVLEVWDAISHRAPAPAA